MNDPEGVRIYSQHLTQTLVGNSAGATYTTSLTDRLTKAELMARQGKRGRISEKELLQAFNALMKDTGAPDSLRADMGEVKRVRAAFETTLPSLISQKLHGDNCNPGEAIFIVEMLVENVGRPAVSASSSTPQTVSSGKPPVRRHLELYFATHTRSETVTAFNHLFKALQI